MATRAKGRSIFVSWEWDAWTDSECPQSFVSLLRWCSACNLYKPCGASVGTTADIQEYAPDSDEAKRFLSEFIGHVVRLGQPNEAHAFLASVGKEERFASFRSRAKELCKTWAVECREVPRTCLDEGAVYWPANPWHSEAEVLASLLSRFEALERITERGQLQHRCYCLIEAMRITEGWLNEQHIFDGPQCSKSEAEWRMCFDEFRRQGWSSEIGPNTVVETFVREYLNEIRNSYRGLLRWFQSRLSHNHPFAMTNEVKSAEPITTSPTAPNDDAASVVGLASPQNKSQSATELTSSSRRGLREPSKLAFAAYQIHKLLDKKQDEVARLLREKFPGCVAKQGQVSRMCKAVGGWIAAGGLLPSEHTAQTPARSVDPSVLEMGRRSDGLTFRQRERKSDDE